MRREEALKQFRTRCMQEAEGVKKIFQESLEKDIEKLLECILKAFADIEQQAQEQEKVGCVYFLFSLLRYELSQNRALVRLDVMNAGWFLDEEPIYTDIDISFLFYPYFQWKEKLLLAMREYRGKVNKYDVEYIIQEEIMQSSRLIAHILRFAFRNIEEQDVFARIPKLSFWNISFGEYKDYSETVIRVNREIRGIEAWLTELENYDDAPEILQCGFWYKEQLTEGNCREKAMHFTVFEECTLKNIDFESAQLNGARFIRCNLEQCSFVRAELSQTEFEQCKFTECNFEAANLKQAVFSPEGLQAEWFDEKQQDEMLIVLQKTDEN